MEVAHDEIPNLVETVKGYMQHERQTLEAVTQARAASISAASIGQKAQADWMLTGALRGLFAVAENYPQLKANENFLRLQNRISELEERIADRREFFNDDVNTYNTHRGVEKLLHSVQCFTHDRNGPCRSLTHISANGAEKGPVI